MSRIGDYLAKVRFNSDASSSVYQQLELKDGEDFSGVKGNLPGPHG